MHLAKNVKYFKRNFNLPLEVGQDHTDAVYQSLVKNKCCYLGHLYKSVRGKIMQYIS